MMIIYNVTCNFHKQIEQQWLIWIKNHIPEVLATGHFLDARLTKVLIQEEDGSATYSVQYKARSRETLTAYYQNDADRLRKIGLENFGDQVLAFRTELELIDEYRVK